MQLRFEHVGHTYGLGTTFEQCAVSDVSIGVKPGTLTLILGPTGSGKSTLLRLGAGLLEPTTGTVRVGTPGDDRAPSPGSVGLVFQRPETQLFAETVLADVAFGPTNLGQGRVEALGVARQALISVGIDPDELGDRSPFTLSGGEARRVALAGVLALQPQFLLLDEPTAGLDAMGRRALHDAIRSVRAQAGIVVVSHDAEEFLGTADHVVVLVDGSVRFSGTRDEVLRDPRVLETDGLSAPDVLRVQMMARECDIDLQRFTLDPATAAMNLMAAAEGGR